MRRAALAAAVANDRLGLFRRTAKPAAAQPQTPAGRLEESFREIVEFYDREKREPCETGDVAEFRLHARLQGIRDCPQKTAALLKFDTHNLLPVAPKPPATIQEAFANDRLGLFGKVKHAIHKLVHVEPAAAARQEPDYIANRKPCLDFHRFKEVIEQAKQEMAEGRRTLTNVDDTTAGVSRVAQGRFYYVRNVLLYVAEVGDRKRSRAGKTDARLRCIFENGTESDMLMQSLVSSFYKEKETTFLVSEPVDRKGSLFRKRDGEQPAGSIYVLQSLNPDPAIRDVRDLYKIGFTTREVAERIRNAPEETTYLRAPVHLVMECQCYDMNVRKFEGLLHAFFADSRFGVNFTDADGTEYEPREWFVAPFEIIEQAVDMIMDGSIVGHCYDPKRRAIVKTA